jgi:50S ribosomal subunit-associated GTPase HflX
LQNTATIRVLNKLDRVSPQTGTRLSRKLNGIAVSARSKVTLLPLIGEMEKIVENISSPLTHTE